MPFCADDLYTTVGPWFVFVQLQNVEVRHHWVAHVRSQWCSTAWAAWACSPRSQKVGPWSFPTWLSVAVRGPANSSALVERVHQIRVIGFALAGLCHLYKPISIIWILYNSPRHNDQLRKEWWISSNFELWFLKRIQKLLVMRTTLGSPSAQGHCEAVIALRSRLSHALVSEDPIKKAHGMSRTGNSYWNGKHLHRNQDGVTSLLIDIQLGGPLEAMIPRCRHPFHNGSLRIFSVWKWYQLMIGWCRQTKVKMFQWMIDEKRQVYKRL